MDQTLLVFRTFAVNWTNMFHLDQKKKFGQPQARIVFSLGLVESTKKIAVIRQKKTPPLFSRARWVK